MAETESRPTNFIRQIIDKDLQSGLHTQVQTRFPPEPNGYLHIGHAKSICLNFGIAQDYQGQCNLRFDDTNPDKEDIDYVNAIKNDVTWLGFEWQGEARYSSNYFDQLHAYALELIEKGLAYVDFSNQEQVREMRGTLTKPGTNSPYRDTSIEENLAQFAKMRNGEYKEGQCLLRAKIDMSSPFMCMRDPALYRVKFAHHHQTGDKWCIYPMYDFTHCISDAIEGITHSLCTLEFQDNRRLYDWVLENITIDVVPRQYEFSRLNLEYTVLSKRKLIQLVEEQYVSGWDDPRMPTIAGLRRRGFTAASIREFCKRIGVTKMDNMVEMGMLEAPLRDELNENAPRAMAVLEPVKIVIENYPQDGVELLDAPNHPNRPEMGSRQVPFTKEIYIEAEDFREEANKKFKRLVLGKEVRLRNAYVIKAQRVEKDEQGNVTTIFCEYDADTLGKDPADGRKVKGVIHWVSAEHAVAAEIRLYDSLFSVPNPAAEEDFAACINTNSLTVKNGWVEPSLAKVDVNSSEILAYQFERTGYFCFDKDSTADKLVFNRTVGLRDTWAKIGD
ncbi:MAG: glutamine--tRNA ligase [Alteromonadaceae bacterium]|uniref:glutamine--tRNA ligase n=1 Tax=Paraglaciecola chathamensis TaxID=368405 RepID=UPI000C483D90|nr:MULTISPECIES: glutamine--tRNA ligase [Paraglaciecola]MBN24426.1 glutamine--tRNA ligase [Alteromonadaceae bacterium]MDO6559533.1 glutamine--tRNA ligase [Paraglaciecola chathamensis]|tara:strand:- start:37606 stop:39282 length:1677 start_codon:yes stop_codon:yes gene_type:complete